MAQAFVSVLVDPHGGAGAHRPLRTRAPRDAQTRREVEPVLIEAIELRRKLVRDHPEHVGYVTDLGLTLGNLGSLLADQGRHDEALAALREAVEHHRVAWERSIESASFFA